MPTEQKLLMYNSYMLCTTTTNKLNKNIIIENIFVANSFANGTKNKIPKTLSIFK